MLVLTRKVDERIFIDKDITILVIRIKGNQVVLGIDAPKSMHIERDNAINKERRDE